MLDKISAEGGSAFGGKKIHIIGIEGAGTSALARMYKQMGYEVSGSDEGDHYYYNELQKDNIKVSHKFSPDNIAKDTDLIIYSTAFKPEANKELDFALKSKIKTIAYPEGLARVFNDKYGIAVCGTHGKTTTSSWLAFVMREAGCDPNLIVGAKIPQLGGGTLIGKSNYFVIEADEYQNKLKYYRPKAVLLNNIEYDHPDFFRTADDYNQAFIDFISKMPKKGILICNFNDPVICRIAKVNSRARVVTYAIDDAADYVAHKIKQAGGRQIFSVSINGDDLGEFSICLSGRHNISNALGVIAMCIELEIDLFKIREYLEEFTGAERRMQVMGKYRGAAIIDDYAHHPTEVRASLSGARELYPHKKIITVFHPHSFTRTKALLNDFAESFGDTDELIVLDIYGSAREAQGDVHSRDLIEKIIKAGQKNASYIPTLAECEAYVREKLKSGDVLILMGAGEAYKIGQNLIK
ncbi:UDP-N-acetylmuramate--L-alanine ligase [Candidatus Falkowbacteria bacterium RIFOXYB2_FULL_34_18]|uniref:UDP-N-acetylmuramate--L-alanine ligase n=1 Tax=Candidatus Falkowbacteria bacterium RIFOXYD2_FULL_34_120 TaxID=1798007 RepID=A0A1F5TMX2_9BACT|nr:MAG: UDP-N-acetylmuramate--L-alanine ligase [Candidatus Falkowbacteria bacterium RIFOXYC12_FULL_34_55]OGF28709.1 MAG: UDP-N-acetylmuramate--L-alanine ligase [Candidatus Falkowbacteria bacterium RIFOXYB2_FULL_34_18]OGF38074.1 MAG: UDP-N-acetylmuramate--L-alanine ligase [Candidatus Falkowbacteria bacterium RIFOXYC2_FULL_34_220]OGF38328.1 MAG: UDP-N-acetylmuramate--L-alanine ligase [Candidatus Falkowbacteria bacterium RIFOXYD12_FULL_34_57]OGF40315.1 MAG: UDP-N-acetylmuramate--L-alanine ligase [